MNGNAAGKNIALPVSNRIECTQNAVNGAEQMFEKKTQLLRYYHFSSKHYKVSVSTEKYCHIAATCMI